MTAQNTSSAVMAQRRMKDEPHTPPTREQVLAPVRRWTTRRKWGVLRAVEAGVVSGDEVMEAHNISAQEFATWTLACNILGTDALKATVQRAARPEGIDGDGLLLVGMAQGRAAWNAFPLDCALPQALGARFRLSERGRAMKDTQLSRVLDAVTRGCDCTAKIRDDTGISTAAVAKALLTLFHDKIVEREPLERRGAGRPGFRYRLRRK
jgi:hypothetical protein